MGHGRFMVFWVDLSPSKDFGGPRSFFRLLWLDTVILKILVGHGHFQAFVVGQSHFKIFGGTRSFQGLLGGTQSF